jgi:orotidine-5'-phosphate decarboxylase
MEEYLTYVIQIAADRVPVVKLQAAYYAALGTDGVEMMIRLIKYAHRLGLLVILDAKRADIGETMVQYGNEVFGIHGADACTFVPYLGPTFLPAWIPWLSKGRCVISMIRTSNPDAGTLQDCTFDNGMHLYEVVASLVGDWNNEVWQKTGGEGSVGGVVGATWPKEALSCRNIAGDKVFFLVPGYGAQSGTAEDAVRGLVTSQGEPMGCVNSSRAITMNSWYNKETGNPKEGDPLSHVANAIDAANADLNAALEKRKPQIAMGG